MNNLAFGALHGMRRTGTMTIVREGDAAFRARCRPARLTEQLAARLASPQLHAPAAIPWSAARPKTPKHKNSHVDLLESPSA